jgi:hypothetical protein
MSHYHACDSACSAARSDVVPRAELDRALGLLLDLVDEDGCWFDHRGGCQAHGYLSLEPGEKCPQAEAKELLDRYNSEDSTDTGSNAGGRP